MTSNSTAEMLAHALRIKMYFERYGTSDQTVLANVNILIEKLQKQFVEGV